jgi:hypothetical protein
MNERIQELNLQAMSIVMNGSDPDGDVDKMYVPSEFTKKFAELIIRECLAECSEFESWYNATPKQISDNIKKHFGVEE